MEDKKNRKNEQNNSSLKISRRQLLKRILLGGFGVSILGTSGYSFIYEPWNIELERHDLHIPNLPSYWEGKKMIQVTDIHCSRIIRPDYISKAFRLIAGEKPDILAITGDNVSGNIKCIDELKEVLQETLSPLENLVKLTVPGNHDYWTSISHTTECFEDLGFTMLINDGVRIGPAGSELTVLGTDDLWSGAVEVSKLLRGYDLKRDAVIMLTHNPDIFPEAVRNEIPVVLAGHSHGGQVNLPITGPPLVPCNYIRGFYRDGQSLMYVNRGLGMLTIPIRFNCSPEIAIFTLRAKTERKSSVSDNEYSI